MLQKKVIIVGASSGLGKEIAILYARQNFLVGITGRRKALLEDIQSQYPQNIRIACFDILDQDSRRHLADLIQDMGGMDLFLFNAGYGRPSAELDWETEDITTRTNVNAFLNIVNFCFGYFVQQRYGQIAITSSVAAIRGNSWTPAYSASKAYMSNYAEGLNLKAVKLDKNIVVTDIRPGFMATKVSKGPGHFWAAPPRKAAWQVVMAIQNKKRVVYITKRWWAIAQILKVLPFWIRRWIL